MSVAAKITASDVKTYLRRTQPDWNVNRKQIHVPCPIHGGVRDSFSMNTETGQWFCNSECGRGGDIVTLEKELRGGTLAEAITSVEQIIGTSFKDFPSGPVGQRKAVPMEITATYSYVDEEGKELFQVARLNPKSFRQRHKDSATGKWNWNLQGVRLVPYRLPQLRNASGAVFFVEGEKDADRIVNSFGMTATTSPGGAGKWRHEYAQYFAGKNVWVIPDNDTPKDKGVRYPGQQHAAQVMRSLLPVANKVMLIELPDGVKDVSDYLDRVGDNDFGLLANGAKAMTPEKLGKYELQYANVEPQPQQMPLIPEAVPEPVAKPKKKVTEGRHVNAVAEEIMEQHNVICWGKDSCWEYNGKIWELISPKAVQQYALEAESAYQTKATRRKEIADYILLKTRRSRINWRALEAYEVPVANGVIDLRDGSLRPHRPEDYLEAVMPVAYDPTAKCAVWPRALQTAWKGDPDIDLKTMALQEFYGYVLMAHAKYKKALLLQGMPDSGKSQILALLQGMVGKENCCSISVKDMDDNRKLAPIKGKMLNALFELSHTAMIADGGFKTLVSTGEPIQLDAKYEQPEQYVPYAKHVIVTNSLPRVNDLTDATFNRMLLLKFNRSIPVEERDVDLLDKLLAEAPGILNWALTGAKRLYEAKGEFTTVPESVQAIKEYKAQSNAVTDFMHLYCRESDGNDLRLEEFRERLNVFRGTDRLSLNVVRRMVKSALGPQGSDNWHIFNYAWKS